NPNQLNAEVLRQAYESGNRDDAAGVLAAQRQRYDNLNAKAQGAFAHGDLDGSLRLAAQAHEQIADGSTLGFHRADDGSITANVVRPGGQSTTYTMTPSQYHSYLIGPATSLDHIAENGVDKHLNIASSQPTEPAESLGSKLRYGALIAGGTLRGLSDEQIQSQLRQLGYAEPRAPQPATAGSAGPTFATTGYRAVPTEPVLPQRATESVPPVAAEDLGRTGTWDYAERAPQAAGRLSTLAGEPLGDVAAGQRVTPQLAERARQ